MARSFSGGQPAFPRQPATPTVGYYWPWMEGDRFGQFFLYSGENDADRLLTAARLMQVLLALLTATLIFLWAGQLGGPWAGLLGTALWVFSQVALTHGHIVQTDGDGTLTILALNLEFHPFRTTSSPPQRNDRGSGFWPGTDDEALVSSALAHFSLP